MLTSVKAVAREVLPPWVFPPLRRLWHAAARTPYVKLNRIYLAAYGDVIRGGPFAGVQYSSEPVGDNLIPKLLGTYELELHGHIDRMLDCQPKRVINIGCAEGYYAVGFARRLPHARIIASDLSRSALHACAELARLNGVADSVEVAGGLGMEQLEELCGQDCLLFIDCEGCERDILKPDDVPALLRTNIIVELHDFVIPDVTATIMRRFEESHRVSLVESYDRQPDLHPELSIFNFDERLTALSEYRPGIMRWAILTADNGA
jgi:precorrin-6B methylase 2